MRVLTKIAYGLQRSTINLVQGPLWEGYF